MVKDDKYFEKLYTEALYKYLVNKDFTWEQGRKIPISEDIPEPLNKHFFGQCIYRHVENIKIFDERILDYEKKVEEDIINGGIYKKAIKTLEILKDGALNGDKAEALKYTVGTDLPMTAPYIYVEVPLTELDIPENHKIENLSVMAFLATDIGTLKNNKKYTDENSEYSLFDEFIKANDGERYKMLLDDVVITRITVISDEGTDNLQYLRCITSTLRPTKELEEQENLHVEIISLDKLTKQK